MMSGFVHWPGLVGFMFTLVAMLALIAVIPLAITLAAKQPPSGRQATPNAEEELRVRYAKGDIDAAGLNERLAALRATERVS